MFKFVLTAVLPLVLGSVAALAQPPAEDVASTIKTMERTALDRSDMGDVVAFLAIYDTDIVYIDPFNEKPLYGREAVARYYAKAYEGYQPVRGEMSNAKVQVLGDTAVLTFNYKSPNKPANGWNCTEVYHHTQEGWRIAQSHWSFVMPEMP
jgi:ketosteroid isomerase-like protein